MPGSRVLRISLGPARYICRVTAGFVQIGSRRRRNAAQTGVSAPE